MIDTKFSNSTHFKGWEMGLDYIEGVGLRNIHVQIKNKTLSIRQKLKTKLTNLKNKIKKKIQDLKKKLKEKLGGGKLKEKIKTKLKNL